MGEGAVNKALKKGLKVTHFMLTGEILEWKSLDEVAAGAGVSRHDAYAALNALVQEEWAEKSDKGYRACYTGLVQYLLAANECLMKQAGRLGLKRATV